MAQLYAVCYLPWILANYKITQWARAVFAVLYFTLSTSQSSAGRRTIRPRKHNKLAADFHFDFGEVILQGSCSSSDSAGLCVYNGSQKTGLLLSAFSCVSHWVSFCKRKLSWMIILITEPVIGVTVKDVALIKGKALWDIYSNGHFNASLVLSKWLYLISRSENQTNTWLFCGYFVEAIQVAHSWVILSRCLWVLVNLSIFLLVINQKDLFPLLLISFC